MGIGGAETHMLTLAAELVSMGHRVTVASERGELCAELKRRGIRFVRVPLSGKRKLDTRRAYLLLRRLLLSYDFDVVHAHSRLSAFLIWSIRKKDGLEFRFIVTAHAKYRASPAHRLFSVWGDQCIAVSRDIKWHLVRILGVDPERIRVIPNGIDTDLFSPSGRGEKHSILFVSRLDADCSRGAESICRIAPRLAQRFPRGHVTVAGGGSELGRIRSMARKANEVIGKEFVRIVGKREDMAELMAAHECVVGVSRVALEAMSMNKTVILCGNEGALGLLTPQRLAAAVETNFTCRGKGRMAKDSALQSWIERALTLDEKSRKRLHSWGRKIVEESYSADKMVEQTLSVYENRSARGMKIAIGGYYGFGNIGDESVLATLSRELRKRLPGCRLTAFTKGGRSVKGVEGVSFAAGFSPRAILNELLRSEVYVSGGGSLLQNTTSTRSLIYYCGMIRLAKKLGNRCIVLANGIGPLHGAVARALARSALLTSDYVSVRDQDSLLRVMNLTDGRIVPRLSADPIFLPSDRMQPTKESERRLLDCGVRYAVVALKGRGEGSMAIFSAIGEYCRKRRLLPVFISMDAVEDERTAILGAGRTGGVAVRVEGGEDVLRLLSRAELAIGGRLHFLIFALKSGVPFLPICTDPKIDAFSFEIFGLPAISPTGEESELLSRMEDFTLSSDSSLNSFGYIRKELERRAVRDIESILSLCKGERGKFVQTS